MNKRIDFFYIDNNDKIIRDNNGFPLGAIACKKLIKILDEQSDDINQEELNLIKRRERLRNKYEMLLENKRFDRGGYVYFALNDSSYVKIGCSYTPMQRVRGLKRKYGRHKLLYVFETVDLYSTEIILHEIFNKFHYKLEWYDIYSMDLESFLPYLIEAINNKETDKIINIITENNLDM